MTVDETLLDEALSLGGLKTKRETVNEALSEYIRKRQAKDIIALFGKIDFDPSYDYKAQRRSGTRKALRKARGGG